MERMGLVQARTPESVKQKASIILEKLGLNMSTYINMALSQLIIQEGIPFSVKLAKNPCSGEEMIREAAATMKREELRFEDSDIPMLQEIETGTMSTGVERKKSYNKGTFHGKKVKSYAEYKRKLEDAFGNYDEIPTNEDIRAFIKKNDLYLDWGILSSEVTKDIRTLVLNSENDANRSIKSYLGYLKKLHKTFGIPDTMPATSDIIDFINENNLNRVWGITTADVSKDLKSFIDGKYDKMIEDASSVRKPALFTPGPRLRTVSKNAYQTAYPSHDGTSYTYVPSAKSYGTSVQKQLRTDKTKLPKIKKLERENRSKKTRAEREETIFIDGDNHITEGQKGIERLPKNKKVQAVFSQDGAQRKFDMKYGERPNVSSVLVKPGDQAVDNRIKSDVGQLLKKGNQDITIVSQDKGFEKYRDRKNNGKDGNRISVAKSVKERNSKKN